MKENRDLRGKGTEKGELVYGGKARKKFMGKRSAGIATGASGG